MPKIPFELSPSDRTYLEALLKKGQMGVKQFKRATALLELARGKAITAITDTLGVSRSAVSTWAKRYRQEGLQMLHDQPRSGRPVEIDGSQRAKVTALACSDPPEGHGRWTLRLLADKAVELNYCEHLSHTQAGEILKKTS
jgi:transposase